MATIDIRTNKKGKISYRVRIRVKGYKPLYKTFYNPDSKTAKMEAKQWAAEVELAMLNGTYKQEIKAENNSLVEIDTVTDLLNYYEEKIAPTKYSYHEKYTAMYDWWRDKIGEVRLVNLTTPMLAQCKILLMTEIIHIGEDKNIVRSNSTINKYLYALSAPLKYAVKDLELIPFNPMNNLSKDIKQNGRSRTLSEKEVPKLFAACKEHSEMLMLFFLLLISTGGRYSEVQTLQVENIDFVNSRVHFLDTKNGTNRGVGIKTELLNFIQYYLEKNNIESGYIFANKKTGKLKYLRGAMQDAIKNAGLEDFHIHDLRHTFASKSAEEGATLYDIAILLGHKSLVMARRYTHLSQQYQDKIARNTADSFGFDFNNLTK